MRRGAAKAGCFAALALSAMPSFAAADCAEVNALIGTAGSGPGDGVSDRFDAAANLLLQGVETCAATTALSGGTEFHCAWAFPYRSDAARTAFAALNSSVGTCLSSPVRTDTDQRLNHPDSYDLRLYEADRARLSLSIKDKAALGKTYVFLRVRNANPD
jgi:hypothetical protein